MTVKQRKDGRYEIRITINGQRLSVYGKSPTEVKAKAKKKQQEADTCRYIRTDKLGSSMKNYLLVVKKASNIKPASYDRAMSIFRNHIENSSIARKRVSAIQPIEIQLLLNEKKEQGYSHSTVKKVYDLFNEYFRYQKESDAIVKNPMNLVVMPAIEEDHEVVYFTEEEFQKILDMADTKFKYGPNAGKKKYRYADALVLLLMTGMRNGELRGMHRSAVDLEKNTIRIEKTISKTKNEKGESIQIIQSPKSKYSMRTIPLNERAQIAVRNLIETTYDPKSGLLVTTAKGNPLSHNMLQRAFDSLLRQAGLDHHGLHVTRKTAGTMLCKNTNGEGQMKEVAEILGHGKISTTYMYYVGTSNEDKVDLVNHLNFGVKMGSEK